MKMVVVTCTTTYTHASYCIVHMAWVWPLCTQASYCIVHMAWVRVLNASYCIVQMASLYTCQLLHCAHGMGTGTKQRERTPSC
jgi:hypothetical protein